VPRGNSAQVEIVDYAECYGDAFERLNTEWLERSFVLEPIDRALRHSGDPAPASSS